MHCIILAGGFATRLWPFTEFKSKPLLTLKDRPLISHIVEKIPRGIPIIVSTNAVFREAFRIWREEFPEREIEVFIEDSDSEEAKKGALGATSLVIREKRIDDDLLLIAGDNYFGFSMERFIERFEGKPMLAAYDIKDPDKAKPFGVVVTAGDRVVEFQEKPPAPKSTLVSTGCFLFPRTNLNDIVHYAKTKKDNMGGIFEYLLQKGEEVRAFPFSESWYDIGSFDAYLSAQKELMGEANIVAPDSQVEGSQLNGSVYVAPRVSIKNCVLKNVTVLPGARLTDCVIRDAVIDENCELTGVDLSHQLMRRGSRIHK